MKLRHLYFALFLAGTVVPYLWLAPWLSQHGLDLRRFGVELFSNRVGGFFGIDVILSAATLCVFLTTEKRRSALAHAWLPLAATLLAGVSSGLPLLLYLRQVRIDDHVRG